MNKSNSWMIIHKQTGRTLCELFNEVAVDRFIKANHKSFEAIPALEYLYNINAQIKAGATGTVNYAKP